MIRPTTIERIVQMAQRYVALAVMTSRGEQLRRRPARTYKAVTRLATYIVSLEHPEAKDMISNEEANKLRELIVAYRDAEIADSFKGAGDPADWDQIVTERNEAKCELETFIHVLEHGGSTLPTPIEEPA